MMTYRSLNPEVFLKIYFSGGGDGSVGSAVLAVQTGKPD